MFFFRYNSTPVAVLAEGVVIFWKETVAYNIMTHGSELLLVCSLFCEINK